MNQKANACDDHRHKKREAIDMDGKVGIDRLNGYPAEELKIHCLVTIEVVEEKGDKEAK